METLFSWIGHADLRGMAERLGDSSVSGRITRLLGVAATGGSGGHGPIAATLSGRHFDRVILLWNYPDQELRKEAEKFYGPQCRIFPVRLDNPVDYEAIYLAVEAILRQHKRDDETRYYLLSPGTPAMAAVWILLGKTKYPGAFLQTYQNGLQEVKIPFELSVDYIPELLKAREQAFRKLQFPPEPPAGFEEIIGESPTIRQTIARAQRAALHNVTVLLTGESGTGKELFARAIWKAGSRRNRPFEAINCAALPANLLEAELFGYKKGAFTGAVKDKTGAFARLDGGTLFLDEVGECSLELQAKLLRVLQPPAGQSLSCREFYPVGADRPEHSDVRIVSATNRELQGEEFRNDLYYRLAAITLHLPPLRERREDIIPIAEAILKRVNADFRRNDPQYHDKIFCGNTKIFIKQRQWRGNVRELFNAVLQGAVMSSGPEIQIPDLGCREDAPPPAEFDLSVGFQLDSVVEHTQKRLIEKALKQTSGNKTQAAKLLGFSSYQRLDAMMRKLGIIPE